MTTEYETTESQSIAIDLTGNCTSCKQILFTNMLNVDSDSINAEEERVCCCNDRVANYCNLCIYNIQEIHCEDCGLCEDFICSFMDDFARYSDDYDVGKLFCCDCLIKNLADMFGASYDEMKYCQDFQPFGACETTSQLLKKMFSCMDLNIYQIAKDAIDETMRSTRPGCDSKAQVQTKEFVPQYDSRCNPDCYNCNGNGNDRPTDASPGDDCDCIDC